MIPKGLFTQIGMVVLAIGIIVTYIQPTLEGIGETQDNIALYQEQREKVNTVNLRLASLVSQIETVSIQDRARLFEYMPDSIDEIDVQRDLQIIASLADVILIEATYNSEVRQTRSNSAREDANGIVSVPHEFTYGVEGSYEQLKDLFRLLEQNNYPLEIKELDISSQEGGFLGAQMTLVTYEYANPVDGANRIVEF